MLWSCWQVPFLSTAGQFIISLACRWSRDLLEFVIILSLTPDIAAVLKNKKSDQRHILYACFLTGYEHPCRFCRKKHHSWDDLDSLDQLIQVFLQFYTVHVELDCHWPISVEQVIMHQQKRWTKEEKTDTYCVTDKEQEQQWSQDWSLQDTTVQRCFGRFLAINHKIINPPVLSPIKK